MDGATKRWADEGEREQRYRRACVAVAEMERRHAIDGAIDTSGRWLLKWAAAISSIVRRLPFVGDRLPAKTN